MTAVLNTQIRSHREPASPNNLLVQTYLDWPTDVRLVHDRLAPYVFFKADNHWVYDYRSSSIEAYARKSGSLGPIDDLIHRPALATAYQTWYELPQEPLHQEDEDDLFSWDVSHDLDSGHFYSQVEARLPQGSEEGWGKAYGERRVIELREAPASTIAPESVLWCLPKGRWFKAEILHGSLYHSGPCRGPALHSRQYPAAFVNTEPGGEQMCIFASDQVKACDLSMLSKENFAGIIGRFYTSGTIPRFDGDALRIVIALEEVTTIAAIETGKTREFHQGCLYRDAYSIASKAGLDLAQIAQRAGLSKTLVYCQEKFNATA